MSEVKQEEPGELKVLLAKISERQKAIARAIADIAIALNTEATLRRDRDAELQGIVLGLISEVNRAPERKRRDSEDTQKFAIGGNSLELTKATRRKIFHWGLGVGLVVLSHVAHALLQVYIHLSK
jgi:hypothetical protein